MLVGGQKARTRRERERAGEERYGVVRIRKEGS